MRCVLNASRSSIGRCVHIIWVVSRYASSSEVSVAHPAIAVVAPRVHASRNSSQSIATASRIGFLSRARHGTSALTSSGGRPKSGRADSSITHRYPGHHSLVLEHLMENQQGASHKRDFSDAEEPVRRQDEAPLSGGTDSVLRSVSSPTGIRMSGTAPSATVSSAGGTMLVSSSDDEQQKHETDSIAAGEATKGGSSGEAQVLVIRPPHREPTSVDQILASARYYVFLAVFATVIISLWHNSLPVLWKGADHLLSMDYIEYAGDLAA